MLTDEQIKNWRQILLRDIDPDVLIMPILMIEEIRDSFQKFVDEYSDVE
jgi:hypothetical protein